MSNLCNHVGEVNNEILRLEKENKQLKQTIRESVQDDVAQCRRVDRAKKETEDAFLACEEYRLKLIDTARELEAKEKTISKLFAKSVRDAQKIAELESQLGNSQALYKQTLQLCNEWKSFCENETTTKALVAVKLEKSTTVKLVENNSNDKVLTLADIADDKYDIGSQQSTRAHQHQSHSVKLLPAEDGSIIVNKTVPKSQETSSPLSEDHSTASHMSSPMPDLYELQRLPLQDKTIDHQSARVKPIVEADYSRFHDVLANEDTIDEVVSVSSSGGGGDTFITSPSKTNVSALRHNNISNRR